jgi:U3 small nucleolar RNA-associated protein 12
LETHVVPTPPLPGNNSSKSKLKGASGQIEPSRLHVLDMQGHRTDVRCLSVSADDQVLASASNGSLKIWNLRTTACIRTMECGYALCCMFMPGDRHVSRALLGCVRPVTCGLTHLPPGLGWHQSGRS